MFNKKILVAVLGTVISAASSAAVDDTARIDNLKWVADITTQVPQGNIVITDINDKIIEAGHEFDLGRVNTDLSFDYNFGSEAILKAWEWEDTVGSENGKPEQGELTTPASAAWTVNSIKYQAVSGGALTPLTSDITVQVNGQEVGIGSEDITQSEQISILLKADAPTEVVENVSKVIATMSISARQDV
ncbi:MULTISPECIES: hypothetical protein [Vibrio harveyi group]|uniref:hypothetical protein n=1 Tax=Vibrio harveyi group TaxID=717610 RepID=UPI001B83D889|nr:MULTISPECIES: hypothetical protein [Vibrio harveyi group]EGQ8195202.1 hypothetical protein [Vibrio parahaemolyticus]MBS9834891.1 hypothetical protein [Vibrio alginolyticus]WHT05029.1 hypothetical protein O2T11_24195 [Vibrio parahaemolyticus]HBC3983211.1 hypothetical protein [Vibrio parahaemolyticus]